MDIDVTPGSIFFYIFNSTKETAEIIPLTQNAIISCSTSYINVKRSFQCYQMWVVDNNSKKLPGTGTKFWHLKKTFLLHINLIFTLKRSRRKKIHKPAIS